MTGRQRWRLAAMLGAAVAFVLGIIGFIDLTPGPDRPTDLVYHTLQLFVLGSDPLQTATSMSLSLEVARFLAPATTAYAAFEALRALLGDEIRRRRTAYRRGHVVVSGDGPAATALARSLHDQDLTVVRIRSTPEPQSRRDGIDVVVGDPRQASTLRAAGVGRAAELYACAPQSATNAAVVLAARSLHEDGHRRLSAYAQVRNDDLVEALRINQLNRSGRRGFTIDFFSVDDTAARLLLDTHDPDEGDDGSGTTIGIVGFGPFGKAVLRAIVRRPHPHGRRRKVVIRTDDRARVLQVAEELDATERGCDVVALDPAARIPHEARRTYVCNAEEDTAVAVALRRARRPDSLVVACLPTAAPFSDALGGTPPVFGILDEACRADRIAGASVLGRAARTIHDKYVADCAARGDTPATNPSMLPWGQLPEHLQESNFAQAEHIGAKLADIGVTISAADPGQPFAFAQAEVQQLARAEHLRWVNERKAAGYRYGPQREGKQHPDLVDWPDLSAESKQKDIDAVEHLPDLLNSAGLYIVRRDGG